MHWVLVNRRKFILMAMPALIIAGMVAFLPPLFVHESDPDLRTHIDTTTYKGRPYTGFAYETWIGRRRLHKLMYFIGGHKTGTERHWYDSGNLWIEREYSKGLPHGEWRQWFESGKVKALGYYTNGQSDGEFWSWYDNGQLAEYNVIKAGQDVTQKTFIKDGAIYNNYVYHNGERVGVVGGEFCKVNKQPDRSQR